MADPFTDCLAEYKTQLLTLAASTSYFPAALGRPAGWQISENDNVIFDGGDYFIVLRPGTFRQQRRGNYQDNTWTVRTFLYMRYAEYAGVWEDIFRPFRAAILELPDTVPLKEKGINGQDFTSGDEPGFLRDENGNYMNFVTQVLDCAITQRVLIRRAL